MELSNQEAALLGLLSEEAMHPYKIEQEVQYRDLRSWTGLSMSSISKLLRKLEKNGLVLRENKISEENRLQKLYSISPEGTDALKIKLESLLREPEHMKWPVDIGLYNSNLLTKDILRDSLREYRSALQKKAQDYKDLLQFLKDHQCDPHRFEVAKRPVFLLEAEMAWVDSYLQTLGVYE